MKSSISERLVSRTWKSRPSCLLCDSRLSYFRSTEYERMWTSLLFFQIIALVRHSLHPSSDPIGSPRHNATLKSCWALFVIFRVGRPSSTSRPNSPGQPKSGSLTLYPVSFFILKEGSISTYIVKLGHANPLTANLRTCPVAERIVFLDKFHLSSVKLSWKCWDVLIIRRCKL